MSAKTFGNGQRIKKMTACISMNTTLSGIANDWKTTGPGTFGKLALGIAVAERDDFIGKKCVAVGIQKD